MTCSPIFFSGFRGDWTRLEVFTEGFSSKLGLHVKTTNVNHLVRVERRVPEELRHDVVFELFKVGAIPLGEARAFLERTTHPSLSKELYVGSCRQIPVSRRQTGRARVRS